MLNHNPPAWDPSRLKILLIDDQRNMRNVLRAMLAGLQFRNVMEASDGAQGLEMMAAHNPHLAIVDWDMPLLNGLELLSMVRAGCVPCREIPIILLTGHNDRWRVVEAARLGVHEFLIKPVSTNTLHERIASIFKFPRPMMNLQDQFIPAPRNLVVIDTGI